MLFSFHESAIIDIPNMIDYILNYTGKKDIYYMGHSMGTTMLYVLLSTRPEYNAKIKLGICLAPIAFWNDVPPVIKQLSPNWPKIMVKSEFFLYFYYHEFCEYSVHVCVCVRV